VLKNALDWLSRPAGDSPLTGRRTALISASPGRSGGENSQAHLRQILLNCGAVVIEHDQVAVGNAVALRTDDGHIEEPVVVKELTKLVQTVLADIAGTGSQDTGSQPPTPA
jgi:chromate reductase